MKKTGKFWVVLVAVVSIALLVFSIVGYVSYYGDIGTTVVKSASDIEAGTAYADTYEITMAADSETDEASLKAAEDVMASRLRFLDIPDYEFGEDAASGTITLTLPYDTVSLYGVSTFSSLLTTSGNFEIRKGAYQDSDGNPTGITADDPIADNSDVKSVTIEQTSVYTTTSGNLYTIHVSLNHSGSVALGDATSELISSTTDGSTVYISFWLDGTMIGYTSIDSAITNGKVDVEGSSITESTATYYALFMRSGSLDVSFTTQSSAAVSTGSGLTALEAAAGAFAVLAVLVLIIKYRQLAVGHIVGAVGATAFIILIMSGSFFDRAGYSLTEWSMSGLIFSGFLYFVHSMLECEKAKRGIQGGLSSGKAVRDAYSAALRAMYPAYAAVFVLGLIASYAMGRSQNWATDILSGLIGNANISGAWGLGMAAALSSLTSFVFACFVSLLCDLSFLEWKSFKKYAGRLGEAE
ncbi:MAG: SecDF P1 head subdomain-containing protein [Oscillospiraceae bacterium]|jgi:hypothetical protein